jgi:FkbM family methyltransferase
MAMAKLMSHQVGWSFDHRALVLNRMRLRGQEHMPISVEGVRVVAPLWDIIVPGSGVVQNELATDSNLLFRKIDSKKVEIKYPRAGIVVDEPCILLGGHYNYYHHLVEYMFTLYLAEETFRLGEMKLLTLEPTQRFQKEIFDYLGIGAEAIVPLPMFTAAKCAEVTVFPRAFQRGGVAKDPGVFEWIRKRFVQDVVAAPERKIYVARQRAKVRKLANEPELVSMLKDLGFEAVFLEDLSFADQVRLFSEAKVIMGPHGAGLANMVFANPGATVVELAPDGKLRRRPYFENLAAGASHHYHRLVGSAGGWEVPEFSIAQHDVREVLWVTGVNSRKKHFNMGEISMEATQPKVVYDIGMHNGDDTDYYLKKGYRVVAVEANQLLCEAARERFAEQISNGRLKILNVAIAAQAGSIKFYVNDSESVLSSLSPPTNKKGWREVECQAAPLTSIIEAPDQVEFVKLDIEGADLLALEDLYRHRILPTNISCEAHQIDVVCKLISMGYQRFKLVQCNLIGRKDKVSKITLLDGSAMRHKFPQHSSGPFGIDLPGRWMNAEQILYLWLGRRVLFGGGWYDVHAMRTPS